MAAVRRVEGRNKMEEELFQGVRAWIVDVNPDEYLRLSCLVSVNGGTAYERLTAKCTHCIIPAAEGKCYSLAIEQGLIIATPDWILDTFRVFPSTLPPPYIYHPSILRVREPSSLAREKDRLLMQAVEERENAADTYIECVPISSSISIRTDKDEIPAQLGSISSGIPRCELLEQIMRELEQRNQELIGMLETEQCKSEQLDVELKECKLYAAQLKVEFENQHSELQASQQEISALEEQVQAQVQAIYILKEEKSELATSLFKCEQTTVQKAAEVERVQIGNKVLQSHIHDLQGAMSAIISRNHQLENVVLEQSELLEILALENLKITSQVSDLEGEMVKLQQVVQEKQSCLDSVQLRVKQTSYPDTLKVDKQVHVPMRARQLILPRHQPLPRITRKGRRQRNQEQKLIPLRVQQTRQSVFSACELVQYSNVYRVREGAASVSGRKRPVRATHKCKRVSSVVKMLVFTSSKQRWFLRHKCRFRHNECGPAAPVRAQENESHHESTCSETRRVWSCRKEACDIEH